MYSAGSLIMYGVTGICRIDGIVNQTVPGSRREMPFYTVHPLYRSGTVQIPMESVENGAVFFRLPMNRAQALAFIAKLPHIPAEPYHSRNLAQLREHYHRLLSVPTEENIAKLIRSIYAKKEQAEQQNRSLGSLDRQILTQAESLLYGELAVALEISPAEVPSYIASTLQEVEVGA